MGKYKLQKISTIELLNLKDGPLSLLQALHCQREVGNLVNFLKNSWCERSAERRGQCLHQL